MEFAGSIVVLWERRWGRARRSCLLLHRDDEIVINAAAKGMSGKNWHRSVPRRARRLPVLLSIFFFYRFLIPRRRFTFFRDSKISASVHSISPLPKRAFQSAIFSVFELSVTYRSRTLPERVLG